MSKLFHTLRYLVWSTAFAAATFWCMWYPSPELQRAVTFVMALRVCVCLLIVVGDHEESVAATLNNVVVPQSARFWVALLLAGTMVIYLEWYVTAVLVVVDRVLQEGAAMHWNKKVSGDEELIRKLKELANRSFK